MCQLRAVVKKVLTTAAILNFVIGHFLCMVQLYEFHERHVDLLMVIINP